MSRRFPFIKIVWRTSLPNYYTKHKECGAQEFWTAGAALADSANSTLLVNLQQVAVSPQHYGTRGHVSETGNTLKSGAGGSIAS